MRYVFIIITIIALVIGLIVKAFESYQSSKEGGTKAERKGKAGEAEVNRIARIRIEEGDQIINDVIIPGSNGRTSQIDHIIVSTKGVVVIETKALSGRIYGSDTQEHWTQVLAYGKEKHRFYSPVSQNETHIRRLKRLLKNYDVPFYNVVVFTEADISEVDSKHVFTEQNFIRFLKSLYKAETSLDTVQEIADLIRYYKENPIETNEEHAAKIKEANRNIEEGRCPSCGAELVLRKSKDGSFFYGCSNYPRCKYTKNIR